MDRLSGRTTLPAGFRHEKLHRVLRSAHLNPAGPMKLWLFGVDHGPIRIHKSLRDPECDVRGVGHDSVFHAVT